MGLIKAVVAMLVLTYASLQLQVSDQAVFYGICLILAGFVAHNTTYTKG
jgi:hypothetical protein